MMATAAALWLGKIPYDWLASFGYSGLFLLSLLNGMAPFAGPSQVATFFAAAHLDPLAVGLSAGIGGAIGELAGYGFGYFLRTSQTPEFEKKIQRVADWRFLRISRERSFVPLLILAAVPNPLFDPASTLAGTLKIGIARYFYPVVIGKVIRHLIIAYVGYYSLTFMDFQNFINNPHTAEIGYSALYILAVLVIAIIVWVVRSYVEAEPDPFFLNLTFFAFAGQWVLTAELFRETRPDGLVLFLDLAALGIVFLQLTVMRAQFSTTKEHYKKLLENNLVDKEKILADNDGDLPKGLDDEIDKWATVMVRITGIDFFPEWYQNRFNRGFKGGPREERRRQAVFVLPTGKFECRKDHITESALEVEVENRKWLWKAYYIVAALAWLLFVVSVFYIRVNK